MRKDFTLLGAGLLAGLLIVAGFFLTRPYTPRGSLIDPPVPAGDFTLPSAKGDFTLSEQRGSVVLIFFGYTTCPDVCPATLGEMRVIEQRLGDDAQKVRFVFVTVDPERDTVERMGQYASNFSPAFYGLSGSEEQLEPVWKAYGVFRQISPQQNSAVGYLVDHTSRVYLVDTDGNLRLTYVFGTPVEDTLNDLRWVLKGK